MDIKDIYKLYSENYLVDTDTRSIRKNSIFFALKGSNFNGNSFAEEAIERGALYSIVDDKKYQVKRNILMVNSVLETLQNLAEFHRKQLNIPIISLTGSNGKTTTKELINIVLKEKFITNATKGNLNNHIGVPLTLLSMTPETEIGIVEMGANHHKEISFLSEITQPDYGYITNFGKAHLEGFGSVEGVIEAKSELYEFLIKEKKKIFINPDDPIQLSKTINADTIYFSRDINYIEANPFVTLNYNDIEIKSNLIGRYNYNNIACAITIGKYFKVSKEKIKSAIENYIPKNNRSQILNKGTHKIILDAYNANPTSMTAALENFNIINTKKDKIVVLGDMFELGTNNTKEHQLIADLTNSLNFNQVILIGQNFYKTKGNQLKFESFEEATSYFANKKIMSNYILIKGSRGMLLERIIDYIN